ncbi:10364_t:CDS:10 [Acaulospora morrowiae]|uniref:Vacuolar protein sorting-associated protein 54 n=1 Tax=Acaulospora morrowiae TaxID=94023 RepID=A0A9N9GQY7_9GLOM|nr:10364_t:CDS:10 [Acaulospora morrowiae]
MSKVEEKKRQSSAGAEYFAESNLPSTVASTTPQTRRFSSSSTRSFDNNDYFSTSPVNQRVSSSMSLYGRGYNRGLLRRISMNSSISNFSTMSETSLPWTTKLLLYLNRQFINISILFLNKICIKKDIGFNAISGVLNNPNSKSSSTIKPSKNDIPSVPHTVIRKIKPTDFNSYIKQITPIFERYSHNKEIGTIGSQPIRSPTSLKTESPTNTLATNLENLQSTHDETVDVPVHRLESTRNPYSVIIPSPASLGDDRTREPVIELPLLETVPSVFFDPDFNLENPRIFDIVCENTDIIGGNPNNLGISTNAILQEKLSHYLDTVEVHLIKEISLRSSSFFAALSNLQALHSETLECVSQINGLRQKLTHIDDSQAKQGLEVVRLKRRRANMTKLYEGIKMVAEIRSTQPMIQVLLGQGDYFSALDLIDEANNILYGGEGQQSQLEIMNSDQGLKTPNSSTSTMNSRSTVIRRLSNVAEKSSSLHLRGVRVLMNFSVQLADMYKMIGTMMENDLLNMLFLDFEECIEKANTTDSITKLYKVHHATRQNAQPFDDAVNTCGTEKGEKLKKRVMPLILGLYRMNRFSSALQAYRERVMEEIKKITQTQKYLPSPITLSESLDDQANDMQNEQSSNIVKLLKGMTFDAFLNMLLSMYSVLLEGISCIAKHSELFSSILSEAQSSGFELRSNPEILNNDNERDLSRDGTQTDEDRSTDAEILPAKPLNESTPSGGSRFSKALKITTGIKSIIQKTSSLTLKVPPSEPLPKEQDVTPQTTQTRVVKSDANVSDINTGFLQLLSDSSQIVFAAADLAHVRCANLIAFRADQNAQLNPKDFYRLYNVTWAFVLECDGLCGRMCYGLRGTISSQAKAFLNHFHMEKTKQGVTLVENEQWIQAEVPIDFQRIVDRIITAATKGLVDFKDDPTDPLSSPISPVFPPPRTSLQIEGSTNTFNDTGKKELSTGKLNNTSSRFILVEDRRFFVVGCSLMLLKMLGDYLRCMANIPTLTTETMNKIIEILNLFNSRTCQVILGAGAMRSAGLKNITAKHLALTSQSLGAIISLIPFIRECIRHNLDAKKFIMLTEFDRIKKDYVNHQDEVHMKLVSIMSERVVVHLRSFQSINWDDTIVKDGPNSYMELLVKETNTLHKVLNKYLPPEILQNVMSKVFKSSITKLSEEISKLSIYTPIGKKRVTTDVQYYITKLSTLEGVQSSTNELEDTVNSLQIKENSSKTDGNTTTTTFDTK